MITIEKEKIDLALYIIELKKAQLIKNNTERTYEKFKKKIEILANEKKEIYKQNEEVIEKVLSKYLKEVQQ